LGEILYGTPIEGECDPSTLTITGQS
jgi:hypothetical protein